MDRNLGSQSDNVAFIRGDAELLPFAPESFDVLICNHVYEHTDNAQQLLSEIGRVLKADGVCYFAGPNKYDLVEPHYGLPFLSWLPRVIADRYMQLTGKGAAYPEKPYSFPKLRKLLNEFRVTCYTDKILHDPVKYKATDILPVGSAKLRVANFLYRFAPFFFPGFVYILKKPPGSFQRTKR
jgi:ubiquinone/menaquinone biosynthesis C-methylase UbiE